MNEQLRVQPNARRRVALDLHIALTLGPAERE
jgi:hypothetical protein